jgi:hypothetical protein
MLSNEEKTTIELEEKYRAEVRSTLGSKPKIDYVEKLTKILQGLAIIIGIWATYNEFRKQNEERRQQEVARVQQEKDRFEQIAKEFRKDFYEKQLEYYAEATEATATLATENKDSKDYKEARKKFYRLFWGKLSIVEDKSVEGRMMEFHELLQRYEDGDTDADLPQASYRLARDARKYTLEVWIDSSDRKNYHILSTDK